MTTCKPIRQVSANPSGRDFVVGDIHGAFGLVIDAMQAVRFDRNIDRLFTVGDLIDRGPESHRVLEFLTQPYVYSVRGNHEDELLSLYASGPPDEDVLAIACRFNGLQWWLDIPHEQRLCILNALSQLPLVIELETPRGTVGFIHADVPQGMSWGVFRRALLAGDERTRETCLWGRSRIHTRDQTGVPGIGRVFVGHTPDWRGVQRYGNVFAIDSAACFGQSGRIPEGHLSLVDVIMRTSSLTAPRLTPELLIEIKDWDPVPDLPFGGSGLLSPTA